MQSRQFLSFLLLPIILEGCCAKKRQKGSTEFQQNTTHQHYRAVKGEMFALPCDRHHMDSRWLKMEEGREANQESAFSCTTTFLAETKHSGTYTNSESRKVLDLQVVEGIHARCFEPNRNGVYLILAAGGTIPCPRFLCGNDTDVIWYKGHKIVTKKPGHSLKNERMLNLSPVSEHHTGVYFCDRLITEQGVPWTLRRAVNVTAISSKTARYRPRILKGDKPEEVELGQPHNLTCEVYFDFELEFSPKVKWYINDGGSMKNMTEEEHESPRRLVKFEYQVIRTIVIKEVTLQHLTHTYTCVASNTAGNNSVTVKLKRKIKVTWPSLVGYPIISVLLVAVLGLSLHVKWLEIQLIYKSHFKNWKQYEDEKEFDVFLSYVWSAPSAEVAQSSTVSSRSGLSSDDEQLFPITVNKTSKIPLEALLPHVLEDQWGYRLCLLERDVVPGGAYTNDVVLAIKRSRMLICVLSAEYLTDSNAVFVLESGVQALLQTSAIKLLLIWTSGASTSHTQPDLPLPRLVQTALRVLPSLDWGSGEHARGARNFWRSLRKTLPGHSSR